MYFLMLYFYPKKVCRVRQFWSFNKVFFKNPTLSSIVHKGECYRLLISTHCLMNSIYDLRELPFGRNDTMVALAPITWLQSMPPIYTGATCTSLILWQFLRSHPIAGGPIIPSMVLYRLCLLLSISESGSSQVIKHQRLHYCPLSTLWVFVIVSPVPRLTPSFSLTDNVSN